MKSILSAASLVALVFAACGSKPDANTQLQKAAAVMAQPEPVQAAPAPAEQAGAPQPAAPPASPAPAQEMNQAIAAYKGGNLDDAVTRLQRLRATPALSPEKRMALNDAMAAVMTEIYTMAAKGDTRAIQAVKLYEQMQTERR